jgi:hypothetical protein
LGAQGGGLRGKSGESRVESLDHSEVWDQENSKFEIPNSKFP